MSKKTYRVLLRNLMYLRNFEPVLRGLAEQGHDILITTSANDRKVPEELRKLAEGLEADFDSVAFGTTYERADMWSQLARLLRDLRNGLRVRRPEYADAPALVERSMSRLGRISRALVALPAFGSRGVNRVASRVLAEADRAIPTDGTIVEELRRTRPDALIVSPMVDLRSEQVDWVRAARKLGIPSCLLVASWDNLTNKGLVQSRPDRVVVWNRFQKDEAVEMHGIPPEAVVVTGAQLYDHWFERAPSRDYAGFCKSFDFDPTKPTLLYCGSSVFIARNEAEFVDRWLEKVRGADDPAVRDANILIRPHPMHQVPFEHMDIAGRTRVAIHPKKGGMPVLEDAKADYYDALYHCSAVIGINTSALIEASILGKRSFTVEDPAYRNTQEGTLHFRYLIEGGILRKAADFDAHVAQLSEELVTGAKTRTELRAFVGEFLRPNGLEKPATPIVIETLTGLPDIRVADRSSLLRLPLTVLLAPVAFVANLAATARRQIFGVATRLVRRMMFEIAKRTRTDGIELLAMTLPIDYPKAKVEILATSPTEAITRTRSVMKEPWTVHWIENVVKPGGVFYDIGANVGVYSLLVNAVHGGQVQSFAFEPGFATYAALCRNIRHNGADDSISPFPLVLHREAGTTVFKYRSTSSGAARHAVGDQGLATKDFKETKPVYTQTMLCISLDEIIAEFGLPVPTHIKLDVDGPELEILEGAAKTLADPALQTVMVELDTKSNRTAITELLARAGLTLAAEFDKTTRRGDANFDAFFARNPAPVAAAMKSSPLKPEIAS